MLFSVMTLILRVTLGCLPPYSEPVSLSPPAQGQKHALTRRERPASGTNLGSHYPAGTAGDGTGWPARGGQHLGSRRLLSLSVSLLLPHHRLFPLTVFLYLLASQTLLPTSLSCLILEFSLAPAPNPQSWGRGDGEFPAGYQLPPSCGWVDIIFLFFQPSPLLGGQGCHG